MNRRHSAITAGACACLATIVLVPAASAGPPKPLPQAQAQALMTAAPAVQSGSDTRAVSPKEAFAAASAPGANVFVAPGLSLGQAVGTAATATVPGSTVLRPVTTAAAAQSCAANAAWHEWGTWPYQQRITDTTYWCAVYGDHITYISSTTSGSGTLCSTDWANNQVIGGGIGYSWFVLRSRAGFGCPTVIPWVTLHTNHYEDVSRNAWGSTEFIGFG